MQPRTLLVTGASDGIGKALTALWRGRGERVIALGRRPAADLDGPEDPDYLGLDLTREDAGQRVREFLDGRRVERLDALVQVAGVGWFGEPAAQSTASIEQLVAVNLVAPIALTHALLPRVEAAQGRIVFVSSVVESLACPKYAAYAATKAALGGFARSLRVELEDRVRVQVVYPGATRTAIHAKAGLPAEIADPSTFKSAEWTAERIARAVDRGTRNETIGAGNRVLRTVGRQLAVPLDALQRARLRARFAPRSHERRYVVTGAAAGIGRALVSALAEPGAELVGVDRDEDQLALLAGKLTPLPLDLAEPNAGERLAEQLSDGGSVDLLVHNAGINCTGPFERASLDELRRVVAVNLTAPLVATARLLERGALANGASLVFVSSLSRFVGYPGAAVYAATKDGLASYARSLSVALAGRGIHVLTVYPGPTRTEHARLHSPEGSSEEKRMPPEELARRIVRAIRRRKRVLVPGASNGVFALAGHALPRVTEGALKRALYDKLVTAAARR